MKNFMFNVVPYVAPLLFGIGFIIAASMPQA